MSEKELSVREKQEVGSEVATHPGRVYQPDVDVFETPEGLWLRADMPGVDDTSVEAELVDGRLTLEGRVALSTYDDLEPVYTEYNVGNFLRHFVVSRDVDPERISARISNGVLEVELPKSDKAKPRKISISAS